MVENRQKVFVYMGSALRAAYGVADPTASHGGPFSYKVYLNKMLKREFWGDEVMLWAVSMMWGLKITVLNSQDTPGVPCTTQQCHQTRGCGTGL